MKVAGRPTHGEDSRRRGCGPGGPYDGPSPARNNSGRALSEMGVSGRGRKGVKASSGKDQTPVPISLLNTMARDMADHKSPQVPPNQGIYQGS